MIGSALQGFVEAIGCAPRLSERRQAFRASGLGRRSRQECEGRHHVDRRGHAQPVSDEACEESRLAITVLYLAV
jgi:hypothetical protein